MGSLAWLVDTVIRLYIWVVIASAILSWLVAFNVVNPRNRVVQIAGDFLHRLTEPALRPIRRVIPLISGIDLSAVVLILLLAFARRLLWEYVY
jgi:YggT family protein